MVRESAPRYEPDQSIVVNETTYPWQVSEALPGDESIPKGTRGNVVQDNDNEVVDVAFNGPGAPDGLDIVPMPRSNISPR